MNFHDLWNSMDKLGKLITLANWGIAASLLFGFAFTVLVIKAGSRKDELAEIEDSKKAEQIAATSKLAGDANERSKNLENANLTLRGQVATLETNAATQQTRAANAEKDLLELQQRLAHRRISKADHDKFVAALRPYRGTAVSVIRVGDSEAAQFADDILAVLREAEWRVNLYDAGIRVPPAYGLRCTIDTESPSGKTLAAILKTLPTINIQPAPPPQGVVALIEIGLRVAP